MNKDDVLLFAGCGKDMDELLFNDVFSEIAERRTEAFLTRRNDS